MLHFYTFRHEFDSEGNDFCVKVGLIAFFRLGDSEADRNIGEELANVQSLDLSDTLMQDWNEIAEIAGRLRRLESLVR